MQSRITEWLRGSLFSIIVFIGALYLFILAGAFEYSHREAQLGPGFWPRVLLGVILVLSAYEIVYKLIRGGAQKEEIEGVVDTKGQEDQEAEEENKRYPALLLIGTVMTVLYALLIDVLGFTLCTFLYLVGFMYVGRYRRHLIIIISSLIGTLLLLFLFVKVVYVSLPAGVPPFEFITMLVYTIIGVR